MFLSYENHIKKKSIGYGQNLPRIQSHKELRYAGPVSRVQRLTQSANAETVPPALGWAETHWEERSAKIKFTLSYIIHRSTLGTPARW